MDLSKKQIFGIGLGSALVVAYVVYKAISDYQNGKRLESIDDSLAKLAGTKPYSSKLIDDITLKNATDKLNQKLNSKL
jgi:hypothetical protein